MRGFHGADCFPSRRLQQKTTLCNHSKLSERRGHTATFSCHSAVTATHTGASPSLPHRNHAAVHGADHQRRSEQQYMIKKKDTFSQVGPVLNEHPDPRTGSPSSRGRQHHHTHTGQKSEVAWRSIAPRTRNILTILQMEAMFLTVI